MLSLLYGTGMRLLEGLRLRVKDVDFSLHQILVRDGKGAKDRVTMLPVSLVPALQDHLRQVKKLHELDRKDGRRGVALPYALEKKYPRAGEEWAWQWVFPAPDLSRDLRSGIIRRHHLHERRIRYFGLLSNRHRKRNLARCRELLAGQPVAEVEIPSRVPEDWRARMIRLTGRDPTMCPVCGRGHLRRVEDLPAVPCGPPGRSPP